MKKINFTQLGLTVLSAAIVCASLNGCVRTESTVTEEVTTSGKNSVETHTRQVFRGTDGKVRVEEQTFYEKVKCVSKKDGRKIDADTPEECFKKGGKVIDKIITKESSEY